MSVKQILSRISDGVLSAVAGVSAVALVASVALLITTQYRVRLLTTEIDRANATAQHLADDSSQLALDMSKAALPAAVSSRAAQLGFTTADITNTVLIEVSKDRLNKEHMEVYK